MGDRTKEPWEIRDKFIVCGAQRIGQIYGASTRQRIVSDHNACLGIVNPETTVPELVAVCTKVLSHLDLIIQWIEDTGYQPGDSVDADASLLRAVLAKTGKQP